MGKETIITKGCKLLLDAFQFVGISSRNGIPNDNNNNVLRTRFDLGLWRENPVRWYENKIR
jgi:hypothetical protein